MKRSLLLLSMALAAVVAVGGAQSASPRQEAHPQPPPPMPPPVVSPEVHSDRSVTFRFRDPNAKEVGLMLEGTVKPQPMQKDDQGVWSITTEPLEPDYYGYSFVADGVDLADPSNAALIKTNLLSLSNMVHVPGPPTLPWEMNDVPHGVVHHHFYHSGVVGDNRDFYVYTPPGYGDGANLTTTYPTLYLLHGYSDGADGWTAVGRANVILDNLIHEGKVKPMVVVMPLGYGAPQILERGFRAFRDPNLPRLNMERFGEALLSEVMPMVQQDYRVLKSRDARAIAGLSMGGAESLFVGLNHLDDFSWVGSFSAGGLAQDFDSEFPSLNSTANDRLHLLWIACGTDDRLIEPNRKFRDWLTQKGIHHTDIETPGMHDWMVWRRNLANFAPLLFQSANGGA